MPVLETIPELEEKVRDMLFHGLVRVLLDREMHPPGAPNDVGITLFLKFNSRCGCIDACSKLICRGIQFTVRSFDQEEYEILIEDIERTLLEKCNEFYKLFCGNEEFLKEYVRGY